MSVGVVGLVANWYAKRQAKKLEAANAALKAKEERLSVPSMTAERPLYPGVAKPERVSSLGVSSQATQKLLQRMQVVQATPGEEGIVVDAAQG